MLFNSFIFWGFFALVLGLYRVLPHTAQNRMLLLASYVFYGYWDWRFLFLIFVSTVVDFFVARKVVDAREEQRKKHWLSVSIATNLGILGFFKYYGFFANELNLLLMGVGFNDYLPILKVVLPVGVSFYTFQTISYTVDVYRGQTRPAKHFLDFALYVSFFPQLVAGPIERSHHLLPQVEKPRHATLENYKEGIYLIVFGMFKKVVIADNMAVIVNHIFSQPAGSLSGGEVLLGVYAFAFQIYGDFSGYSSIAQGLAKLLGFDLMWNFRMPYFAGSPSEFWQRWHISLSSWLRDYLYIPLGGNRGGTAKTARNLSITMLLGGLWHGAAWTFVVWGAFHGALLVIYRVLPRLGNDLAEPQPHSFADRGTRLVKILLMFHLVCISWLLFRADSMQQVLQMSQQFLTAWRPSEFMTFGSAMLAFFVAPLIAYELWLEKAGDQLVLIKKNMIIQTTAYLYLLLMLLVFVPVAPQVFIYFQF